MVVARYACADAQAYRAPFSAAATCGSLRRDLADCSRGSTQYQTAQYL